VNKEFEDLLVGLGASIGLAASTTTRKTLNISAELANVIDDMQIDHRKLQSAARSKVHPVGSLEELRMMYAIGKMKQPFYYPTLRDGRFVFNGFWSDLVIEMCDARFDFPHVSIEEYQEQEDVLLSEFNCKLDVIEKLLTFIYTNANEDLEAFHNAAYMWKTRFKPNSILEAEMHFTISQDKKEISYEMARLAKPTSV